MAFSSEADGIQRVNGIPHKIIDIPVYAHKYRDAYTAYMILNAYHIHMYVCACCVDLRACVCRAYTQEVGSIGITL